MSATPSEAERAPSTKPELVKEYRAIGPAVLVAALLCAAAKERNAEQKAVKAA